MAIELSEIDGTVKGLAAVVSIDLLNPDGKSGLMHTIFEEDESNPNPMASAQAFWRSIEKDWPNHSAAFVGNHRAKYLNVLANTRRLGMSYNFENYIEGLS